MTQPNDNSQFANGKGANLNFAGTKFTHDATIDGPMRKGLGRLSKNSSWLANIFAAKALRYFKTKSVVEGLVNNDYYGEINNYGDSVYIIKEPVINSFDYTRGQKLISQALDADKILLKLDKAKAWQYQVDDIEKKLSHIDFGSLAKESTMYDLSNNYDKEVLNWIIKQVPVKNIVTSRIGMAAIEKYVKSNNTVQAIKDIVATSENVLITGNNLSSLGIMEGSHMELLDTLNRMGRTLDKNEVPMENRWIVVSPEFIEILLRINSDFINADWNTRFSLINGNVSPKVIRGFKMHKTVNTPKLVLDSLDDTITTDFLRPNTDGRLADRGDILLGGHKSAIATVTAITTTEAFRSKESFADIQRGLCVYGYGLLRPESLTLATVTYDSFK